MTTALVILGALSMILSVIFAMLDDPSAAWAAFLVAAGCVLVAGVAAFIRDWRKGQFK